jgi:hypothetical protein
MFKITSVSIVLVLLIGSIAPGGIVQDQVMAVNAANGLNLLQSQESGNSSQNVIISITQDGDGIGMAFGSAHMVGLTSQLAGFSALSSLMSVGHGLIVSASISPLASNALADQARLQLLMLSVH